MKNSIFERALTALLVLLLLPACSTTDKAIFVTKTSLTILDVDTTPPDISIAYDRTEGFFGPAYENGAAAPVTAIIQSNGNLLAPKIRQLYATGNAAEIVSGREPSERAELTGKKRPMFFGTTTNIGLKLSFAAEQPIPTSVNFGYKRKEFSIIPIGTTGTGTAARDHYPSVIASIDNTNTVGDRGKADLNVVQFFATGSAADSLAPQLKKTFDSRVDELVAYNKNVAAQRSKAGEITYLYAGLPLDKKRLAWKEADKFGLYAEDQAERGQLLRELEAIVAKVRADGKIDENELPSLAKADELYAEALFLAAAGYVKERLALLEIHQKTILELRKP